MNGKTNLMWNHSIQIPTTTSSVRLQSLLWTQAFGGFTTEDDEVCKKCGDCKPAAHHVELFLFSIQKISYVFNTENTAILYNDELVRVINSKTLLTSNEFMKNVYMCFYAKGNNRWCNLKTGPEIQPTMVHRHVTSDEIPENFPWALSDSELKQVKEIWKFRKKVYFMRCTISSHQLLHFNLVTGFVEMSSTFS